MEKSKLPKQNVSRKNINANGMLGAGSLYTRRINEFSNNSNINKQSMSKVVTAIKQNREYITNLENKTESLEKNILVNRSLLSSNQKETEVIENKMTMKMDLMNGDVKEKI